MTAPASRTGSRAVWLMAGVLGAASVAAAAGMLTQGRPAADPGTVAATRASAAPTHAATGVVRLAEAPACKDCGVVESVRAVTRKGEGSGLGAVAGGVVGGLVGNQFGKGDGRKAMTVVGAVGGGLAGHEIEKRSKSTTVHEVTLRMDDGSTRTITQSQAPKVGEHMRIEKNKLVPVGDKSASAAPKKG